MTHLPSDRFPNQGDRGQPDARVHQNRKGRAAVVVVASVLGLAVLAVGLLWVFQRSLFYYPDRSHPGPASAQLPGGTDVELRTSDNLVLQAWRFDPNPSDSKDMAVLFLPGNGGNRLGRVDVARSITAEGFTVILMDYRGYGGNPGTPTEEGLLRDAQAAVAYLHVEGFGSEDLICVGESLGTGVAAQLAAATPPAAILLRSPFTSLADVASKEVGGLPIQWFIRDPFNSLEALSQVAVPVTVLAGDADDLIPLQQSQTIADAAPNLHELVVVPGADHNDMVWVGDLLAQKVVDLAEAASG